MATTELGSGKTVIILAVVVGCFGVLWPRVFYPMMQAVFMAAKPRELTDGLTDNAVCCDVIYENNIDLKYFAELCHSVLEPTKSRVRQRRRSSSPPPGTIERCRQKILELCDLDINDILHKSKGVKNYRIQIKASTGDEKQKLNLSECLEKHFQFGVSNMKKPLKQITLPSHMRQERSPRLGPSGHPALMERGQPFQAQRKVQTAAPSQGSRTVSGIRPNIGAKPDAGTKGGGAMGFLMPIYTVGIIVFFLYTITKVLLKKTQGEVVNDTKPKINTFHMDPEYRKYVLSEQYHNNMPISYQDYLSLKANGVADSEESETCLATKLLSNGGRKQVFTAIEGIIAEMDDFRERVMVDQPPSPDENQIEDEELSTRSNLADDMETALEELNDGKLLSSLGGPLNELSEHLKHIIQQDRAKIAVLGMETQAQLPTKSDITCPDAEVSNIVLEKSVPVDAQLLVTESQCLTHTSVEHIDGWSECDDNPIIVTGKMTISLLGNDQMAVINSDQTTQAGEPEQTTPTPDITDDEFELNNEENVAEQNALTNNENTAFEINGNAHISS